MNRLAPFLAARRRCRHPRPPAPPKRVEPRRWPPARRPGRKPTRGAPAAPGGGGEGQKNPFGPGGFNRPGRNFPRSHINVLEMTFLAKVVVSRRKVLSTVKKELASQ